MQGKQSKLTILKKKYSEFDGKNSISLGDFIELEAQKPEFYKWFFGESFSGSLSEKQQLALKRFIRFADAIQKRVPKIKSKDSELHLKLSKADKEKIQKKADKLGLTLSAYVRKKALDDKIIIKTDFEMVRQVRKIGVNINQIAHKINQDPSQNNINLGLSKLEDYIGYLQNIVSKLE